MAFWDECGRCHGDGHEPRRDLVEACRQCGGRGKVRGRPDHWPAIGARLASTTNLETFEVKAGERFGLLELLNEQTGDRVWAKEEDLGKIYVEPENATEGDPHEARQD